MRRAATLFVLCLLAAVPAGAAGPAEAPERPSTNRPAIALRTLLSGGNMTLAEWLGGLRSALETRTSGLPLAFLGGELPDGCDDFMCPSIRPIPAGDLDGDGSEDVLTSERIDDAWTLKARRGRDGSVSWSTPIRIEWYGYAFLGRADVIGDSNPEVVLLEAHTPYVGVYEPLAGFVAAELKQRVRVLRPSDGSVVWERSYDGLIIGGGAWAAGNLISEVRDLVIGLSIMPDATGDGVSDVLLERASRTNIYAALGAGTALVRTSADTLDGTTGAVAATLELQTTGGYPIVVPSGDLSGDGLADLITLSGSVMTARSVSGGAPLWQASLSGLGRYPYPIPTRFNSGPLWDVAVETDRPDLGFVTVMTAFRGLDGTQLWSYQARTRFLGFAGDVDEDGAMDLVDVGLHAPHFTPLGHRFSVVSGSTGEVVRDQVVTVPVEEGHRISYWNCYKCVADVTGDGVSEIMLRSSDIVGEGENSQVVADVVSMRTLSDGSTLWERRDQDSFFVPVPLDSNGNGTSDLADYSCCAGGEGLGFNEGSSGELLDAVPFVTSVESPFGAAIDHVPGDETVGWLWFFDPQSETYSFGVEVANSAGSLWSIP